MARLYRNSEFDALPWQFELLLWWKGLLRAIPFAALLVFVRLIWPLETLEAQFGVSLDLAPFMGYFWIAVLATWLGVAAKIRSGMRREVVQSLAF